MKALAYSFWRAIRQGYGWVSVGMFGRAGLQAVLVVLLARMLGPDEYGVVVAITSVTGVFSIFMGAGATALHLRDLSTGRIDAAASFSTALRRNLYTALPLLLLATWCLKELYGQHVDLRTIATLAAAELVAFGSSDLMQRTSQGRHHYGRMAIYVCLVPASRVTILLAMVLAACRLDIENWAFIASISAAFPMLAVAVQARHRGIRDSAPHHSWLEGLGFAVAAGSTRVHADADKAIVARMSSLNAAAQYSLAYRFYDVLMLPIQSYIEWRMPALFRSGDPHKKAASSSREAFIAPIACGSLVMILLAWPTVSWLPTIFGAGYEGIASMGRWLVLLPATSAAWWVFRSLLFTRGEQSVCGAIELVGAAFNVIATVLLVGWFGWKGAVVATYATHVAMASTAFFRMAGNRFETKA